MVNITEKIKEYAGSKSSICQALTPRQDRGGDAEDAE
jgi:hypothetical protein